MKDFGSNVIAWIIFIVLISWTGYCVADCLGFLAHGNISMILSEILIVVVLFIGFMIVIQIRNNHRRVVEAFRVYTESDRELHERLIDAVMIKGRVDKTHEELCTNEKKLERISKKLEELQTQENEG